MFEALAKLYGQLPEGAKQIPAATLLVIAITGYTGGKWMSSAACQALRDADQKETNELRKERDEYKTIAFNSVQFLQARANQSAKINEKATAPEPNKPVVATVKVPVKPVTTKEKQEVASKLPDAQPDTLQRSLDVSKKVLEKSDISNAKVEETKKP